MGDAINDLTGRIKCSESELTQEEEEEEHRRTKLILQMVDS